MTTGNGVFIVTEAIINTAGSPDASAYLSLISPAKTIADALGQSVTLVTLGSAAGIADAFAKRGVASAIEVNNDSFSTFSPTVFSGALSQLITDKQPSVVLFLASTLVGDYVPRVAVKTEAGLLSGLSSVSVESGQLHGVKGCLAESMLATVAIDASAAVQFATIKPKAYDIPAITDDAATASVENFSASVAADNSLTQVSVEQPEQGLIKLEDADIIVSGGRGLQAAENFALVETLAKKLNAGVGASRAIVDAGWRPHSEQIGQTGKTVNPNTYIAVGISGAIQHLVGMRTSRTIIAINRDAEAPIFKVADFGIVGDALEIIPKLNEAIG